ncbi:MAG TPA: DUF1549 domain-containing protein, partial [Caulifigura sp.]|nr:DUF1549 domain-containing protein [Caulifigura sp.]
MTCLAQSTSAACLRSGAAVLKQDVLTRSVLAAILLLTTPSVKAADPSAAEITHRFEAIVAPALAAKCVACHRPDNLKGGFDMTTREGLLKGGDSGEALKPGQPTESPIYTRAIPQDGRPPEMPEKGEPLTTKEAEALQEWITAGAQWSDKLVLQERAKADANFWSFQPIADDAPPTVDDSPAGWPTNPIDRFVLAKLRQHKLQPNPAADPRSFVRRATYDLTGLPPTPEEVESFERECPHGLTDIAVERLIDRLLD